jgi:uncharacterized circularly permuted ATP-grasp superfamily protein
MSEAAQQQSAGQTNDELIAIYVQLRDKKDAEAKALDARLAPVKEAMARIEQVIHQRLLESGTQAFKTAQGTAFLKEQTSVTVKDWAGQTLPFIIQNQRWDLLECGVNKTATLAHMEANKGAVPPGVNYSARMVVQIRRGKDKE